MAGHREKVEEIVQATLHSKPKGEIHWSTRSMAKHAGVSRNTVQRIWKARGLKPHLVDTFKISTTRRSRTSSPTSSACI